jgi:hypothetical protein
MFRRLEIEKKMNKNTLAPLQSLLSKSEKAITKLRDGTWQHTMLTNNIKALRIALALMDDENADFTPDELGAALIAFADMTDRTEKSRSKFSAGTSQHTLQDNRLKALRVAESAVKKARSGALTLDWLSDVKSKLKRGNKILFAKDSPLFHELNDIIAREKHKVMVLWALELAGTAVNTLKARYPNEMRPQIALDTSRAWAMGEVKMREAKRAILNCHAFAKEITSPEDITLCHAVGQACGVVHANGHAVGFPVYELTAMVHRLGVDSCKEAIESRTADYIERIAYWRGHYTDCQGKWADFLETIGTI